MTRLCDSPGTIKHLSAYWFWVDLVLQLIHDIVHRSLRYVLLHSWVQGQLYLSGYRPADGTGFLFAVNFVFQCTCGALCCVHAEPFALETDIILINYKYCKQTLDKHCCLLLHMLGDEASFTTSTPCLIPSNIPAFWFSAALFVNYRSGAASLFIKLVGRRLWRTIFVWIKAYLLHIYICSTCLLIA